MKPVKQENGRLGFVGIGYMGRPIARRLLESGFKLTAYDREHSKAEELIKLCKSLHAQRLLQKPERGGALLQYTGRFAQVRCR